MRLGVAASLDAKEHQRFFQNGVEYRWVDKEVGRGVVPDNKVVFSHGGKRREVRSVQVFSGRTYGIQRPEFVHACDGIEGAIDPDIGLYGVLLDKRKAAVRNFRVGIRVDYLEGHVRRVGDIGVLVILGPKSALVQTDRPTVVHVQRVEVSTLVDLVGTVDYRELIHGVHAQRISQYKQNSQQSFQIRHVKFSS